ncbi:hypothetical protein BBP40_011385 [Aspergillus hancockii]|nr:hypothetical protein BBP40_011385 [Aspergillus hancockii]
MAPTLIPGSPALPLVGNEKGVDFDLDRGPLWRVGIYNEQDSFDKGYFLAVTLTHILTDGMGLLQIFRRLLRPFSAVHTGSHTTTGIQRSEDTVEFTPRFLPAASSLIHEILAPVLPRSFLKYIGITPYWPAPNPLPMSSTGSKERFLIVDFGRSRDTLVPGLESFGKLSGSGSVQSLLHTAGTVALIAVSEHPFTSLNALKTETPISIRNELLGHPPLGGNFTALGEFQAAVEQLYC